MIMAIRFLGLFLVLPLLALYAMNLEGANEFYVGIALGAYALSQMLLQVIFGKFSDKYGRKTILAFGLFLLVIGSVICAISDNIYMLIFGRLLQGAGAIGGVVLAYISDLSTEENRAKAFAKMGMMIAGSFGLSMVLGPIIGAKYGVDTLFYVSAIISFLAIIILYIKVPQEPEVTHFNENVKIKEILKNTELLKIYFSGFMQKGLMSAIFLITPMVFVNELGWDKSELYRIYLPALLFGILAMPFGAIMTEKKNRGKSVFIISAFFIFLSVVAIYVKLYVFGVILFFIGFNLLEPILQSYISKIAKSNQKATALGVGNSIQYLGIFVGGSFSGYFLQHYGVESLMLVVGIISFLWLISLFTMQNIMNFKIEEIENYDENMINDFKNRKDVYDVYIKNKILIVKYK
jgi:MFS family permease